MLMVRYQWYIIFMNMILFPLPSFLLSFFLLPLLSSFSYLHSSLIPLSSFLFHLSFFIFPISFSHFTLLSSSFPLYSILSTLFSPLSSLIFSCQPERQQTNAQLFLLYLWYTAESNVRNLKSLFWRIPMTQKVSQPVLF